MNLNLLKVFIAVVERGGVNQAAQHLAISQPAISKNVQELERQLGLPLFYRVGRSNKLTEAGELLYANTRSILAAERAAENALEQLRNLETGQLFIGASRTIGSYILPTLMGQFRRRHPHIRLFLDIRNTPQIAQQLLTAELEVAFVESEVDAPEFDVRHWQEDELVVIASMDHQPQMTLANLQAEEFIVREPEAGTRQLVERYFKARGLTQHIGLELSSNEAIKQAVMAGMGIAIVSRATVRLELQAQQIRVLEIPDFQISRPLTRLLVKDRPISPALRTFLAFLDER
jgi:DNA-binding transcriptional LysR family regulator